MHSLRASFVTTLVIGVSVIGCASSGTRETATRTADTPAASVTAADVNSLAGTWRGWWVDTSGAAQPLEVEVNPNGTYTSRIAASTGVGQFKVVDGTIVTSGHLLGPTAPVSGRTAVVTIAEKSGRPALKGDGRTEYGPYSFELTKER